MAAPCHDASGRVGEPGGAIIRVEAVSQVFVTAGRPVRALDRVSFAVEPGEFLAVVGPSGCGKSTLLHLIAGLLRPTAGAVYYRGERVDGLNTRVGYMTQKDHLLPWRSVQDNIGIALEIRGVPRAERARRVQRYVELMGLAGFERHHPHELSGGMRKRVLLARTLIYDPETILMDEPFGSLDAQLRLVLGAELLRLWERSGKTIVFVTHDLAEAIALADRVVVFSARPGRIKAVEPVLLPRPRDIARDRFTAAFGALHGRLWSLLQDDVVRGLAARVPEGAG